MYTLPQQPASIDDLRQAIWSLFTEGRMNADAATAHILALDVALSRGARRQDRIERHPTRRSEIRAAA